MNAVETLVKQAVLKSVEDYNNSIEMLDPGVRKYFRDNYDDVWCSLYEWHLIGSGNNIEIAYMERYSDGVTEYNTDVVPLETIVSIAVELSLNKKL